MSFISSFAKHALSLAAATMCSVMLAGSPLAHAAGECEVTGPAGSDPIQPAEAGTLTVETALPSPGWWNGDTPDTIKDGYEYCLAANIAHRAGLEAVKVENVAFDALVTGRTKNFDIALSSISVTEPRRKVVDFSVPYFNSDIGVVVKKGTAFGPDAIKDMRIGVKQASTGASFVERNLKPAEIKVFPDDATAFTALTLRGRTRVLRGGDESELIVMPSVSVVYAAIAKARTAELIAAKTSDREASKARGVAISLPEVSMGRGVSQRQGWPRRLSFR